MISVKRRVGKILISENYGSFKILFNYIQEQRKSALSLDCSERKTSLTKSNSSMRALLHV